MAEEKKAKRKVINTARDMGQFMKDYYYELNDAATTGNRKIAWCTSVGPTELLRAMGFLVYFPETHGAMLGSTRTSTDVIPTANALGYSPEICSYLTSDIGAYLNNFTPLAKAYPGIESVPRPDVLVYNTNQCRDVQDWFTYYGREFGVPVIGIETNRSVNEVNEHIVDDIAKQIEALVPTLQEIVGQPLDMEQFKQIVGLSRQCSDRWKEVLETASAHPAPLTFFDASTLMGPAVVGRGTQIAVDLYDKLLAELKEKVAKNDAAIEGEKFRIYWDGMPVWGRLSAHAKLFAGLEANVLASTYCSSWIFTSLEADNPFRSMARAYTELFIVRSDEYKEKYIKDKLDFYGVDGIIYHDARTCPNNSNCRYGMVKRIEKESNIPSLTIDGDLCDMRCVSDEQTKTKVEAFIEQLSEIKG